MDLRHLPDLPSDEERAAVDALLGPRKGGEPAPGMREARSLRHLLLPGLHAIQDRFGWIRPAAFGYLCERLHVPPAEAFGVASFYALFSLQPRPPLVVHVCDDIACRANGAEGICQDLERRVRAEGESLMNGRAMWLRSPCLGQCDRAPAALVQGAGTCLLYTSPSPRDS